MNPDYLIPLSKVNSFKKNNNSVVFEVDFELFEIAFLTDALFDLEFLRVDASLISHHFPVSISIGLVVILIFLKINQSMRFLLSQLVFQ